jgi:uncharacterized UPF0160 family protein|tara:strand:- start:143 stop:1222 length:1080 start_codon:yes stop_codon:yes gene_type:complete|mmetsp:Transcript_2411/g.7399  ORF Transcript_2411/g.7399 Transcript_2411/m.7399 type:complete len:360 (+) Transcript_2411:862-1941(+)
MQNVVDSTTLKKRKTTTTTTMATTTTEETTIGTHDGSFHCDEALGCYLLRQTRAFLDARIVRSRDARELDACAVVIDVGAEYDAAKLRFDHHQKGFEETLGIGPFTKTKLSSAGLVYKHFGKEIVAKKIDKSEDDPLTTVLYLKMYENFVEAVDGVDNGVAQFEVVKDTEPKYKNNTSLSSRVGKLNPSWNEPFTAEHQMEQFLKAVALTGKEFDEELNYLANAWLPGRKPVEEAIKKREEVHESGKIIKLEQFCPWKDHLYELEKESGLDSEEKRIEFVLFEDSAAKKWRVSTVPIVSGSFDKRKGLKKEWAGLRDQDLSEKSGIPGCVFVHNGLFIGGNDTYEGALEMARISLEAKD